MSRMDWRKARPTAIPSRSVRDDEEFRERDADARWLERMECKHCGSVLSAVTFECVRGRHCPGVKRKA